MTVILNAIVSLKRGFFPLIFIFILFFPENYVFKANVIAENIAAASRGEYRIFEMFSEVIVF